MIHVKDVAFVRYQAPDLDAMEAFMKDFGSSPKKWAIFIVKQQAILLVFAGGTNAALAIRVISASACNHRPL